MRHNLSSCSAHVVRHVCGVPERPELNPGKIRSGKTHLLIRTGTAGGKIRLTEVLAQPQEEASEEMRETQD